MVIVAAEIDGISSDCRRRENLPARVELPFDFVKRAGARRFVNAGVGRISAKSCVLRVNLGAKKQQRSGQETMHGVDSPLPG